jgi:hypothetical protein
VARDWELELGLVVVQELAAAVAAAWVQLDH